MGGTGRRAQVAFFVLLGVILLIAIVIAIYLIQQQRVQTHETSEQLYVGNPELAAEAGRMQQRVDDCLSQTAQDSLESFADEGADVSSLADAEAMLEEDIALSFPNCFYRFNTASLFIEQETPPTVHIAFSNDGASVTAHYIVSGEYQGAKYSLSDYQANIKTGFRPLLEKGLGLRASMSGTTPTGSGGSGTAAPSVGEEFIDKNCYVNLYAYQDEGIYADLTQRMDGTMQATFYDYDHLDSQGMPGRVTVELPPCIPAETPTPPQILDPITVNCQANNPCSLALPSTLPEDVTIIGSVYVNPLTYEIDTTVAGTYTAVAYGYTASGEEIQQPIIIGVA